MQIMVTKLPRQRLNEFRRGLWFIEDEKPNQLAHDKPRGGRLLEYQPDAVLTREIPCAPQDRFDTRIMLVPVKTKFLSLYFPTGKTASQLLYVFLRVTAFAQAK